MKKGVATIPIYFAAGLRASSWPLVVKIRRMASRLLVAQRALGVQSPPHGLSGPSRPLADKIVWHLRARGW